MNLVSVLGDSNGLFSAGEQFVRSGVPGDDGRHFREAVGLVVGRTAARPLASGSNIFEESFEAVVESAGVRAAEELGRRFGIGRRVELARVGRHLQKMQRLLAFEI